MELTETVTVKITEGLKENIQSVADQNDASESEVVRTALMEWFGMDTTQLAEQQAEQVKQQLKGTMEGISEAGGAIRSENAENGS
jgi:Arc/MetJ-type ribon-helix-helix transcriptional regulator